MKSSPDARLVARIAVALVVMAFAIGGGAAHAHTGQPVAPPPAEPAAFAKQIDRAQAVIEDPGSSPGKLAGAGLAEELSTGVLASDRLSRRRATLALLSPKAAATERTDLAASAGLSRLPGGAGAVRSPVAVPGRDRVRRDQVRAHPRTESGRRSGTDAVRAVNLGRLRAGQHR
jgi:hypothetical protein